MDMWVPVQTNSTLYAPALGAPTNSVYAPVQPMFALLQPPLQPLQPSTLHLQPRDPCRAQYRDASRLFVSRSPAACNTLSISCAAPSTAFVNACGCGCVNVRSAPPMPPPAAVPRVHACKAAERDVQVCTQQYAPVCGVDQDRNYALATYGNACEACRDPRVDYYVRGACPRQ